MRIGWVLLLASWSTTIPVYGQKELSFAEDSKVIDLEQRSRRKFDNALIADLDQDGWLDLLLTEHGRRVEVFWNNKGKFRRGDPFIFGDTHGMTAVDHDFNGKIDVIVQPGGGGGATPSRPLRFEVDSRRKVSGKRFFDTFEGSRGRAVILFDPDSDGKLDLITTAFAARDAPGKANRLYKANQGFEFEFVDYLPVGDRFTMRTSLTDFNNDGKPDVLFGGGGKIVALTVNEDFSCLDVSDDVLGEYTDTDLVSSISEIDIDNDGDLDLFITRSRNPFGREADYDPQTGRFYFFARMEAFLYDSLRIDGDLRLENLLMAYPHFDVLFGEKKMPFERKTDRHGHQDLTIKPEQAEGWPEDISGKGLYIGYLGDGFWRIGGHTKSPTSGVVNGVIDNPGEIALRPLPALLLENRGGKFFDVSGKKGLKLMEQTTSAAVGDFNNDGWSDIFVLRYGNPAEFTEQLLFLNQGGKRFLKSEGHGLFTRDLGSVGMGAGCFDYDKDGDLDIICANERGRWHLFTNKLNTTNRYIEVNVGNSPTGNASALGAVLTVEAGGNIYKRTVGSTSAAYSQNFNTLLHVGLGDIEKVDKAMVKWSNGEELEFSVTGLNKIIKAGSLGSK